MNARKFFSETVAIAGATPVSMETLLKNAGWGYLVDPVTNAIDTTQFSMDSFTANEAFFTPAGNVYVGEDQFVRDVAGVGPPRVYQGTLIGATTKFTLSDFCRGIVDPARIWFYSAAPTTAQLVFDAF